MKILKIQVLRGPNVWSNYRNRLIQVRLDLEEMEGFPSDKIEGFTERFMQALPGMVSHECSEGKHGGFFERLRRGTWMGHIMEHTALELQSLAGMENGYGRTRGTNIKGVYNLVFSYTVEQAGIYAADAAFRIVQALAANEPVDVDAEVQELRRIARRYALGPSTQSIVDEARRRGIPWMRLGRNSKIQLGHGANQMQFQATMTAKTSDAAVRIAGDKDATKQLLQQFHIPVASGDVCASAEGLREIIETIGFPIVVKPLNGNHGKGATINISSLETAVPALEQALAYGEYAMVERFIEGFDFRLLVIDGKFTAASKRVPAHVVGDGVSTVEALINAVNSDPRRGEGHESVLTKISLDLDTYAQLEKQGLSLASIPTEGQAVYLKSTANLSTGGTAIDVTDEIHPENKMMAERIARIIGLDICGIDIMARAITEPLRTNGGVVLEVNAAPGFRMHLAPSVGKSRNVAAAVVDMLYPQGKPSTIPLFAVTGTNGKTTTTRLLAHIAQSTGYHTGYTTTDGIYIGGYKIKQGDTTGPVSGTMVLRDPTVEFAVLETARGGLLRGGLCFDSCDVGIITNIQEDHLGLNDVHTLEDLANVKAVIARSVKETGWAVLNAEDVHCMRIAKELDCNVAYFAMDAGNAEIRKQIEAGMPAALLENGFITIVHGQKRVLIGNVADIPITDNGRAEFMIANVLAASVASYAYGFTAAQITNALQTFIPGYNHTPGRMNLFEFRDFKVLVDYAHNPHGFLAMKEYLSKITATRKIGIIAGIGDRRPQDTIELASIAATMFDHIIVRQEHSLRGRTIDEINTLVVSGIHSAGTDTGYDLIPEEGEAIEKALDMAQPGDFIVALSDDYETVIATILKRLEAESVIGLSDTRYSGPVAI